MYTEQRAAEPVPILQAPRPAAYKRLWVAGALLAWYLSNDWLLPLCIGLLWFAWQYLRSAEGPPVLALAFSFQWLQVASGLAYNAITGRPLLTFTDCDYRPMVLIGAGCLGSLALGLKWGLKLGGSESPAPDRPAFAFSFRQTLTLYIAAVGFSGLVQELAWLIPSLTQGILVLTFCRFAFLFLLFRRLVYPKIEWRWFLLLLFGEVLLGFTGYFAGFRESVIIAALALVEIFEWRKPEHWAGLTLLAVLLGTMGLLWTGIKGEYRSALDEGVVDESRSERLRLVTTLGSSWGRGQSILLDLDRMIDRLWAVYYPALAVSRVPAEVPHSNGAFFLQGLTHVITPRAFFPNKAPLLSDSEKVRRYSGVQVAGEEEGTSIAFGYAAEFYVDFGLPWMFLPVLGFGCFMGWAYQKLLHLIVHRDVAIGLVTVIFWLSLYSFERSWARTIGLTLTIMIFLGGAGFAMDRLLLGRRKTPLSFNPDLSNR
jgi:hypothetical protein